MSGDTIKYSATWRRKMRSSVVHLTYIIELQPGERLILPESLVTSIGEGRWIITVRPATAANSASPRSDNAFLDSYAPEDEGLYDDDVKELMPDAEAAIAKGFYSAFLESYALEDEGLYDADTAG